ncbi:MAG: formylglycine-generating enzyme family protein, partial [Thermoguttaceae bacterium]
GGITITLVDLTGTFNDSMAPMAPLITRPDYRMLGAIFQLPGEEGLHFIKCYGPKKTITDRADEIKGFLTSLKVGAEKVTVDLGKGVNLELVLIPAGEFMLGSPDSDKDGSDREKPQHRVRITKPFYLGKNLVTQEQWEAVTGGNPSHFKGPKNPVEMVSWDDCQQFLGKLNAISAAGVGKFQLPSEAQWEYACRAGSKTRYCFGDDESKLGDYAWYRLNSGGKTHPVGEKKPNAWGLYDMHGNVWGWCQDWYEGGYYAKSPRDDPTGAAAGSFRVFRGGSWFVPARDCRSAGRNFVQPGGRDDFLGLRISLVPADKRQAR